MTVMNDIKKVKRENEKHLFSNLFDQMRSGQVLTSSTFQLLTLQEATVISHRMKQERNKATNLRTMISISQYFQISSEDSGRIRVLSRMVRHAHIQMCFDAFRFSQNLKDF